MRDCLNTIYSWHSPWGGCDNEFVLSKFNMFSSTSDPHKYLMHLCQMMVRNHHLLCKVFPLCLTVPTLLWFHQRLSELILSFGSCVYSILYSLYLIGKRVGSKMCRRVNKGMHICSDLTLKYLKFGDASRKQWWWLSKDFQRVQTSLTHSLIQHGQPYRDYLLKQGNRPCQRRPEVLVIKKATSYGALLIEASFGQIRN